MSPIVEFRLRCPDFVLAPTLAAVSTVTLDIVTEVATDPERPYLYVWATGDGIEDFEREMDADPTIASHERYTEVDDRILYRIQASPDAPVISYPVWVEAGATRLGAHWEDGWWHVQMRYPDRETVAEVREWCDAVGADFELERVYTDAEVGPGRAALTDEQRQVLRTAYEVGYFEIPRRSSMADVAAELDLSSQAVSERLRRGYRRLVEQTLL